MRRVGGGAIYDQKKEGIKYTRSDSLEVFVRKLVARDEHLVEERAPKFCRAHLLRSCP